MRFHDAPPGTTKATHRHDEMRKLVQLFQKELDEHDAEGVPAVVENIVSESPFTEAAANRLKRLLPKLGKSAYEVAIKVITDVGSATAKRLLGL
jgi:hypothetical protein